MRFEFCVSFLIATVRCQSGVVLTESWQQRYVLGMGYNALAIVLGPWGIPWGPLWTIRAICTNLTGGVDVTDAVLAAPDRAAPASAGFPEAGTAAPDRPTSP